MKKSPQAEPDIAGLIVKIEERLSSLEKKIDTLIGQAQAPARTFEAKPNYNQPRRFDPAQRILHKAVCADCRKECEVPFKPTGDRPVYCKECFSKRKANSAVPTSGGGSFNKPRTDFRQKSDHRSAESRPHMEARPRAEAKHGAARPFYKRYTGENRKTGGRKRSAPAKRKKRA